MLIALPESTTIDLRNNLSTAVPPSIKSVALAKTTNSTGAAMMISVVSGSSISVQFVPAAEFVRSNRIGCWHFSRR